MDIVTEVLAAGLLSIMAGIIALLNGAYVVGAIIILGTSINCDYTLWTVPCSSCLPNVLFQVPKVIAMTLVTKIRKRKG